MLMPIVGVVFETAIAIEGGNANGEARAGDDLGNVWGLMRRRCENRCG